MRASRIILIVMLTLVPAREGVQALSQGSPASIEGIVVDAATNLPVSGAVVELTGIVESPGLDHGKVQSLSDVTGKDGKFILANLQPGSSYQLTASENDDYTAGAFGQHSPSDPWTPLSLTAGQKLSNVRLVLTPISSITGKVVDGEGKPLRTADVYVLRATYPEGRRELLQIGRTQTNDSGEFFVGRLGTGQYYVRVSPKNSADYRTLFESPSLWDTLKEQRTGEPEGYPTTYFPNTMDLAAARPIDLLNGGKIRNLSIVVEKVHTRRVSGSLISDSRIPQESTSILLVPRTAGRESSFTRSVHVNQDGQFDFRGVLPGAYTLIAVVNSGTTQLTARKPVDVRNADLQKLTLAPMRGFDFPGTIRFADWQGGAPPDYSQLAINLVPDTSAPIDRTFASFRVSANTLTVPPSSNGEFVLRNVAPGDYRIRISLNPRLTPATKVPIDLKAGYMTSLHLGDADILDDGLHVDGKPEGRLQIVLATNSGSIFGRVLDENHEPVVPARMVIVPEKAHRKRFDLFSLVAVSATGRFTLDGIPPGNYKLFAWAHVENGAWYDPEFMRVYEDRGTMVQIEESGSYPIEIPLIH